VRTISNSILDVWLMMLRLGITPWFVKSKESRGNLPSSKDTPKMIRIRRGPMLDLILRRSSRALAKLRRVLMVEVKRSLKLDFFLL
jgi:hypothetical protein